MAADAGASVLILDADSRPGLACVQSLGAAGHTVHIGVRRHGSLTEQSRWARRVHVQPPDEPVDDGAAWLRGVDERHGFTLIIPATEASLRWLRRLPADHPARRKAVLSSDAALDAALDKERTRTIALGLGLPAPDSRLMSKGSKPWPADGPFPKVLKPVTSKVVIGGTRLATLAVVIARNAEERDATLAVWLPITGVQEQTWVPGRGVGVEVLYNHGQLLWHAMHERLHERPLTGGASTLRRAMADDAALLADTKRLLDHLQWHGVAMVEWRRDASGATRLMEINPRLWGSLPLTLAAGIDMPGGLLALARGDSLPAAPTARIGVTARNLSADLHWSADNARADKTDPLLLTEPVWRATLGWLRVFTGRETWDGWSWRDPAVALAEVSALIRDRLQSIGRRVAIRSELKAARRRHAVAWASNVKLEVPSILVLCLGNICRSPFAAEALRHRLPSVDISSAGFIDGDGRRSPHHVAETARTLGIDVSQSRSRRVNREQVDAARLIICMDADNLQLLADEFPDALHRATLLGLFRPEGPAQMRDPIDLPPAATRAVLIDMLAAADALAARLRP